MLEATLLIIQYKLEIVSLINKKRRKYIMANVAKVEEKYSCPLCGNEVEVTKVGGKELVCCGQVMEAVE